MDRSSRRIKKASLGAATESGMVASELRRIADLLEKMSGHADAERPPQAMPGGKAFSWRPGQGIVPVPRPACVSPELLVGMDAEKSSFYENIERFISGSPSLDVLLWGERGTGKTSLVASLLSRFPAGGWGIVQVLESHLDTLPRLLDLLEGDGRRWVVFMDDLNLSGSGAESHELKLFLEGGLSRRPENTMALVTSNRRHIVPEKFPDSRSIHPEEDTAEVISLADRFGLSIGFSAMDQETWLDAVASQMQSLGNVAAREQWRREALQWAMEKGIRSGRSAAQFARLKAP